MPTLSVRPGLAALAAALLAASTPAPLEPQQPQRFAVVVGVGSYASPSIPSAGYARADARAFHDFLRSPAAGLGGFPESHVRLLLDDEATIRNVRSVLTTFLRQAGPRDVVFIFLAGQGVVDPYRMRDPYFLTYDAEMGSLPATALSMTELRRLLHEAPGYLTIVFADAPQSHALGSPPREGDRLVILTAAEAGQVPREGEEWGGHGVFTHFLLRGLGGEADSDGDGVVDLGELVEYVRDQVARATRNGQVPALFSEGFDRYWPMAAVMNR